MAAPTQWRNAGPLSSFPQNQRRIVLAQVVARCEGKIVLVARTLGYHRTHIHRLLYRYRLWHVVNKSRLRRLEREAADRRRLR